MRQQWPLIRDVILFTAGLAGVAYEAVVPPVDETLLLIYAAMMGLPAFLRGDEAAKP